MLATICAEILQAGYTMHFTRIFLLSFIFLGLLADDSPGQQDPNDSLKHLDPGIAILRTKTGTFSSEFCSFILEAAPQEVKDKVALLKDPYCPSWLIPKKILLYGPSGSGKTTLAQVIAQEIDRPFIYISAGLLGNEYKNSVAQNLRRAIEPYKDTLCVVIIDEIDCILKKATNDKDLDQHTPKQVWEIIDLCAKLPNVLVIGITNDVRGMDEPLQTRFAGDTVEVPLLNSLEMRKKTILFHLQAFVYELNDSYITSLAKKTKKFSHRELEKLVISAMTSAYLNKKLVPIVGKDDFEKAYKQIEKSRSLLNKINWADYEKHLQYGIQIAGLVVNIASLVTNWRMSWLNYLATQKNQSENINNQNRIHEDAKKHQNHLAAIGRDHAEKLQQESIANSNRVAEEAQMIGQWNADRAHEQNQQIADRNERRSIKNEIMQKVGYVIGRYLKYDNLYYNHNGKGNSSYNATIKTKNPIGAEKLFEEGYKALDYLADNNLDKLVEEEMQKTT